MKNKYLIETIYRMMEEDASFTEFNANEIFLAFMNGYYYIKPNEDTMKFAFAIDDVIAEGHAAINRTKRVMRLRGRRCPVGALFLVESITFGGCWIVRMLLFDTL